MSNPGLDAGALGIDFGSSRSVIAVAKKRGIDILVNEASQRETINLVTYGPNERFMGEQAEPKAKTLFKSTVGYFNRLLGVPADYPPHLLKNETRWISSKVGVNANNKLAFNVNFQGEDREFLPEQVTAAMLGKLKHIIKLNNLSDKEAVLSVPNYYTEAEKKALLDACRIAELTPSRLITEAHAIATGYGIFRKNEFKDDKEPRHVVFVDLGHSKFSAFLASFTKDKATVLSQVDDRALGARDMDWILLNYYDNLFQKESSGLSIMENKKAIIRTLDVISKQRKILSANLEAPFSVEALIEDYDLHYTMKREEFQTLVAPILKRVEEHCLVLFSDIMSKQIQIHSVEIIGGASRIPAVQEIVQKVFKKDVLMKTLNASECIARGCATQAAVLSPQFHVLPYTIEDANYHPIKVEWKFIPHGESSMEIETKSAELFKKGCIVPNVKSLTFKHKEEIKMRLYYEPAPEGFPAELATLSIPPAKITEEDYGIKVRIKLNDNGIVVLTDCNLIEDYTVDEKIEIKKEKPKEETKPKEGEAPKEGETQAMQEEPQYEIKQKKKTRTTPLKYNGVALYHLAKKELDDYYAIEASMMNHDRSVHETQFRKNELESYIYGMRDRLVNGALKSYTEPVVVDKIIEALDSNQNWLYGEGAECSKSLYVERTEQLRKLCEPSVARFREEENFQYSIDYFNKVISEFRQWTNTNDPKYEHIGADLRQKIIEECNKAEQWIKTGVATNAARPKHIDATITYAQAEEQISNLKQFVKNIQSTPKVQPKKDEPAQQQTNAAEGAPKEEKIQEEETTPSDQKMDVEQ